jgi:hypothetical protein
MQDAKGAAIDPAMPRREVRTMALHQPVPGKARHNSTGNYRDQYDNGRKAETPAEPWRYGGAIGLQMHQEIGRAKKGNQGQYRQVAPVLGSNDFTSDDGNKKGRKREVRSQRPASVPNENPLTGTRLVQFGIAVRMKPAMTANTKPKSIS